MRFLTILLAAGALLGQNQRQRGQSGPPDESQSWTRGRMGTQQPLPGKLITFDGILIDASCDDRTAMNLQKAAAPAARTDVAVNPGQSERSCAITKGTRGFALLTSAGRLLNLDEGGNTLALQSLHASPEGRAMLDGTGGGIKPHVTLRGRVQGDRLIVDKIVKL